MITIPVGAYDQWWQDADEEEIVDRLRGWRWAWEAKRERYVRYDRRWRAFRGLYRGPNRARDWDMERHCRLRGWHNADQTIYD